MKHERGFWNMACWNGLNAIQQARLITHGNLPINYEPAGKCPNGAQLCIETESDAAGGPRFYCLDCAIEYLQNLRDGTDKLPELNKEEQAGYPSVEAWLSTFNDEGQGDR
jgi:hypothetical protein